MPIGFCFRTRFCRTPVNSSISFPFFPFSWALRPACVSPWGPLSLLALSLCTPCSLFYLISPPLPSFFFEGNNRDAMPCVCCHSLWKSLIHNVQKWGKIRFLLVFTVNSVMNGYESDTLLREENFTNMDKTTKIIERSCWQHCDTKVHNEPKLPWEHNGCPHGNWYLFTPRMKILRNFVEKTEINHDIILCIIRN